MAPKKATRETTHARHFARQGIDNCLSKSKIDLVIGPGNCAICATACLAGYPTGLILKGEKGMGQPQGLMMISTGNSGESEMLRFMRVWERDVVGEEAWSVPGLLTGEEGRG
jgi:amidase